MTDREAFTEWARERQLALLRTAILLRGDRHRAEDLVQEALAKMALRWRIRPADHGPRGCGGSPRGNGPRNAGGRGHFLSDYPAEGRSRSESGTTARATADRRAQIATSPPPAPSEVPARVR
jgi:hypothetical protein